jgi:hypothetical protein
MDDNPAIATAKAISRHPGARPCAWATWMSNVSILGWLVLCTIFGGELPRLVFLDVGEIAFGYVLPIFALGLNLATWLAVRSGAGAAKGLALTRALFTLISFPWLTWTAIFVFLALFVMPLIGFPALLAWLAQVSAEIIFIVVAVKVIRAKRKAEAS